MFKDSNNNYRLKIAFDFDGTLTEPDRNRLNERDDTGEDGAEPKKAPYISHISAPPDRRRRNRSVHTCNGAENGEKSQVDRNGWFLKQPKVTVSA